MYYDLTLLESLIYRNSKSNKEIMEFKSLIESNDSREDVLNKLIGIYTNSIKGCIGGNNKKNDDIDKSNGDISKWVWFPTIESTLSLLAKDMNKIYMPYIYTINTFKVNILLQKNYFIESYRTNSLVTKNTYRIALKAIAVSSSLLLFELMECKSNPSCKSLNKVPISIKNNSLFKEMDNYNKLSKSSEFDLCFKYFNNKHLDSVISANKECAMVNITQEAITFLGAVAITTTAIALFVGFLSFFRNLIYYFYLKRSDVSDYLTKQAEFLKIHEIEVKNDKRFTNEEKRHIIENQRKWRERLLNIADTLKVDDINTSKQLDVRKEKEDKEVNLSNIRKDSINVSNKPPINTNPIDGGLQLL